MLKSIGGKNQFMVIKGLFWGSKSKIPHIFWWILILCKNTFHLICWNLLTRKKIFWLKKGLLWWSKNKKLNIFQWNPILCKNTFHLISWNLMGKKTVYGKKKAFLAKKGAFFGGRKAKNRTFFGEFLFSVKIPFIWYAGIYKHEKRYFG